MEYKIENEFLEAVVCSKGCELVSVKTKKDGAEHIWQGNPDAWKRHAPVLFPLVGKYKDNKIQYQGKTYEMSQHGFARDRKKALLCNKLLLPPLPDRNAGCVVPVQ